MAPAPKTSIKPCTVALKLARRLAERGWNLILVARGAEALEAARAELARRTRVVALAGDVTEEPHRQALAAASRELGGLDALVNNAGALGPSPQPPLLAYPLDVLEQVYRTNAVAPLGLLQAVQHALKPGACILNVTSDAAVEAYEGWGATDRARPPSSSSRASSRSRTPRSASTGSTPATCARRGTRTPSPAKTSATAPCRKRASRG